MECSHEPMQYAVRGWIQTGKKKPLDYSGISLTTITIVGAQEGTRTPTKLLAST